MSGDGLISEAGLTILIDPALPESHLAFAPTRAMINELGILATWLPVRSELPRATVRDNETPYQVRRRVARERYAARERARYFAGIRETASGDAALARSAILWCAGRADPGRFCETLLRRVWIDGVDFEAAVSEALTETGNGDGFEAFAQTAADALQALEAEVTELGLYRGPAYVVNGETFQGREHLPLIRWRLLGETGTPPV